MPAHVICFFQIKHIARDYISILGVERISPEIPPFFPNLKSPYFSASTYLAVVRRSYSIEKFVADLRPFRVEGPINYASVPAVCHRTDSRFNWGACKRTGFIENVGSNVFRYS